MLVIRRRIGEKLLIGDDIELEIIEASGGRVRLGIQAPRHIPVLRGEVRMTRMENSQAATLTGSQVQDLLARLRD